MTADSLFARDPEISEESRRETAPVRLLVVDDHCILREGVVALLEREKHLLIEGSVGTGSDAIRYARRLQPSVVIMDLVLPDINGVDASRRILSELPATHIIILSSCHSPHHLLRALRSGARGYVMKAAARAELVFAIHAVTTGIPYVTPGIIDEVVDERFIANIPTCAYERLSSRELEVLRHVVSGASSSKIAHNLCLSKKTVDTYRNRLMLKLNVTNRSELIRLVIDNELLST